jgi:twinkle protein
MVIALERNLSAGDSTSNIRVLKNRFNGKTGPAGAVSFDGDTGRMIETTITQLTKSPSNVPDDYSDF